MSTSHRAPRFLTRSVIHYYSTSSSSSSSTASKSTHILQQSARKPASLSHVSDAGGATMVAAMRAIELTKSRSASPNETRRSSGGLRSVSGSKGGEKEGGGLMGILAMRRKSLGVTYDQDANEISSIGSSTKPSFRQPRNDRSTVRSSDGGDRPRRQQSNASTSPRPATQDGVMNRAPRTNPGPRPPRQASGPKPGQPMRPPRTRSMPERSQQIPSTPLIQPSHVELPSLNLSSLPTTSSVSSAQNKKSDYTRYLVPKTSSTASSSKVLKHAEELLSRNPSIGFKGKMVLLNKVEEALSK